MCGINGIALSGRAARTIDASALERMRDCLTHRGPDGFGLFIDGAVGLGHRRLSIVDVAAGQQPMTNEDGTLHIIFNGEIYNHADFRAELESRGHRYQTHCDTETILHLYEEHGAKSVERLRGMFAYAIWDQRRRELFIARDRLGIKPLYYAHTTEGSLYFASEIKALLDARAVSPELNFQKLPDYLANHATSGEETLFRGIRRLLPGHTLIWRDGQIRIEQYWDIHFKSDEGGTRQRSDKDMVAEWTELFRDAVRSHLMADVPLGMFLSGGIDSSAIAAIMSRMTEEPIKTFSVAFAEREANELQYARLVADKFRTDHHEVVVSPEDFFGALPQLVWHEDEPLAHPSSVALYFVSKLAAQHVKVVLTGEGSDESLGGYERYYKTILNLKFGASYHKLTVEPLRRIMRASINSFPSNSNVRQKLARTFLYRTPDIENLYFDNFAVFTNSMQQQMLTQKTKEQAGFLDPYQVMRGYFESSDAATLLDRMLYADLKTYLHELLMKQDQMSMAASLESRVPFLDHKLVEFSAHLPARMKIRRGRTTKYILRESMKNILPQEILTRPKMGFPVPVGKWFRGAFRNVIDEYVLSPRSRERGLFDESFIRRLVNAHQAGEKHDERLWSLVNLEIWMRRFLDDEDHLKPREAQVELAAI
jgi:asparagine synthase (glutamine-hydrolysing)